MIVTLRRWIAAIAAMQRQVIAARTQIGVLGIWLPDNLHAEHLLVKSAGSLDIVNRQRQMAHSVVTDHR